MKQILLIITGSIAAYKTPELIRLLTAQHYQLRCVLTKGGSQFVTPLTLASLSQQPVYSDLFSLKDETDMGHIRLSREADLILVAPASADIIAKCAHGLADDLASTLLLASSAPLVMAPAMNVKMWNHPATQRNLTTVKADGIRIIEPSSGELACGEIGEGRMAALPHIVETIKDML